ncbi:MAG TPA: polysaccharide lyase family 7 protein [Pseudonocardia sp.]
MSRHRLADYQPLRMTPAAPPPVSAPSGPGRRRWALPTALAVVIGLVGLVGSATAAVSHRSTHTAAAMAAVADPSGWYLTLPTGRKGDPDTVQPPKLGGYSSAWFHLDSAGQGLVFTANAGGVTTSGSSYPRSELREMDGGKQADWSNTRGTHTLTVRQAVTALPKAKPEVVTAQIHDSADDVMEIRLEGSRLIAEYNDGRTDITLDPSYSLGDIYDLKIVAADGRVRVFYNGTKKVDVALRGSGWYFKSGSYVQSNTSKGDKAGAVATVVIYQLRVTHS